MNPNLRDKARTAATGKPAEGEPTTVAEASDSPAPELDDIEYTGPITDAAKVPVHVAFARVMADVQVLGKKDKRDDPGGRYMFRGVDTTINAVGPALRRHGVVVLPVRIFDVQYREARTSKGTVMEDCTLKVEWLVVGPAGDSLPLLQSTGQATDTGDKATAKAVSVAQRVLFLSGLHIPTHDPTIDRGHDRGEAPVPKPLDFRDEALRPDTTVGRLRAMRGEVVRHGLRDVAVTNETGDEEGLLALIDRVGRERSA